MEAVYEKVPFAPCAPIEIPLNVPCAPESAVMCILKVADVVDVGLVKFIFPVSLYVPIGK